jgi:nuclear transport factor 2 (NTF2) superfamily protein
MKCKLILAFHRKVFHRQKGPVHNCFTGVEKKDNFPVDKWKSGLKYRLIHS